MQNTPHYWAAALALASLTLAVQPTRADDYEKQSSRNTQISSQLTANELIGKKVKNAQDEDLGKVQDLIVSLDSGRVPYAVIAHGGAFGTGRTKTAVPINCLQCSSDGKTLILSATKEQLQAASKTPTGAWSPAANAEWARTVDGFYGEPAAYTMDRNDRQRFQDSTGTRQFVRDPQPKGAELLMQPADRILCEKVCDAIDNVQVHVENGVATLYGQVESQAERESTETKVRAVPGVQKVESHLKVKNP